MLRATRLHKVLGKIHLHVDPYTPQFFSAYYTQNMEAAPLPDGDDLPLKVPAIEVVDLTSGDGVHASLPVEVTQAGESGSEDDEEGSDDQWEDESLFEDALEGMGDEQLLSRDGASF